MLPPKPRVLCDHARYEKLTDHHAIKFVHLGKTAAAQDKDNALVIEASSASSSRHLNVFVRLQEPVFNAVVLFDSVKQHGSSGHIDSHRKRLRRKQQLK